MARGGRIKDAKGIRMLASRSKKYQEAVRRRVDTLVEDTKKNIIAKFNVHPVTKEIEAGSSATNMSNLLGGYGNLFTYIGFRSGSNPVSAIRRLLATIRLLKIRRSARTQGRIFVHDAIISFPSEKEISNVSRMPWEPKSWVYGIERGIDGFGYYMYKRFKGGRSKGGLQSEDKINDVSFRTDKYLPTMLIEAEGMIKRGRRR